MTGAEAINSVIVERGMTRSALAVELGINRSAVSRVLSGDMLSGTFTTYMDVLGYGVYLTDSEGWEKQITGNGSGSVLKAYMKEHHLTQVVVSKKMGIEQARLSHMLLGLVKLSSLIRTATALECTVVARNDDGDEITIDA